MIPYSAPYTSFPERVWERLLDPKTGKHTGKWASRDTDLKDLIRRGEALNTLRNQGKTDEGR